MTSKSINGWTHHVQRRVISEEQEISATPTFLSSTAPSIRKGLKIVSDAASATSAVKSAVKLKSDSSVGVNARSGSEYYDKWEKVAEEELLKLNVQDNTASDRTASADNTAGSSSGRNSMSSCT